MKVTKDDVERNVSLVVKTFERPDVLHRLVESVRAFYPTMPLLVVDDSEQPLDPLPAGVTRYWHLPFNQGLAYGRNFGLGKAETDYVLFADDDMVFTAGTDLRKLLHVLRTTSFDVVSCAYVDCRPGAAPFPNWFEGTIDIENGVLVHTRGANRGYRDGYPIYDALHNFFMARRDRLGVDPWDARLKSGGAEHVDFFLTLKERGLLSTRISSASVEHRPIVSPDYARFRVTREYHDAYFLKRGLVRETSRTKAFDRKELLLHRCRRAASYAASLVRRAARGAVGPAHVSRRPARSRHES